MIFLVSCILLAIGYLIYKTSSFLKGQAAIVASVSEDLAEIKAAHHVRPPELAYGWYDAGWPYNPERNSSGATLENPKPHQAPDDYATQMYIAEFRSMLDPHMRKEFLWRLRGAGVWMKPELLDVIFADESPFVRAWAAGHLLTDFKDYKRPEGTQVIRDYEPALAGDSELIVRASLWSNPRCNQLPWWFSIIQKGWKEQLRVISQLERLGMMRNPELSKSFVVCLMETSSKELTMTREEHSELLRAAAINPDLIYGSRTTGRKSWVGGGEGNSVCEEYGRMWELCMELWLDQPTVPFYFFRYIQTTPQVKLATYKCLLEISDRDDLGPLREEVIRSCDPYDDRAVLDLAKVSPDENQTA